MKKDFDNSMYSMNRTTQVYYLWGKNNSEKQ